MELRDRALQGESGRADRARYRELHANEVESVRRVLDGEDWPALLDLDGNEERTFDRLLAKRGCES